MLVHSPPWSSILNHNWSRLKWINHAEMCWVTCGYHSGYHGHMGTHLTGHGSMFVFVVAPHLQGQTIQVMQKLALNALGDTVVAHDDVVFCGGDTAEAAYFVQSGRLKRGEDLWFRRLSGRRMVLRGRWLAVSSRSLGSWIVDGCPLSSRFKDVSRHISQLKSIAILHWLMDSWESDLLAFSA